MMKLLPETPLILSIVILPAFRVLIVEYHRANDVILPIQMIQHECNYGRQEIHGCRILQTLDGLPHLTIVRQGTCGV